MTPESFRREETRMLTQATDALKEREQFFAPASLKNNEVFCGDDRSEDDDLHLFGGSVHNVAVTLDALKEVTEPGSVTEPLEKTLPALATVVAEVGKLHGGIHSDEGNEGDSHFHAERTEGGLGCKKIAAQTAVSELIATQREKVINISSRLAPELFESEEDLANAAAIADAHGRLAERTDYHSDGRKLAIAVSSVVPVKVLPGQHNPEAVGIVVFEPGIKFASLSAMKAGEPAYTHDIWALSQAIDNIRHLYPYDKNMFLRANLMDTVATMLALGIPEDKIFRR